MSLAPEINFMKNGILGESDLSRQKIDRPMTLAIQRELLVYPFSNSL
jgi:hypothetical protein